MSLRFLLSFVFFGALQVFSMDTNYLVVLRHGHGEHLISGVFSSLTEEGGGVDHHLTEQGCAEVTRTAQDLLKKGINRDNVKLVLVSPLNRTKETAQILVDCGVCAPEVLQLEDKIREHMSNHLEGLVKKSLLEPGKDFEWVRERDFLEFLADRGAESLEDLFARIDSVLDFLENLSPSEGHIILVTHGAIVSTISSLYGDESPTATAEARIFPLPSR